MPFVQVTDADGNITWKKVDQKPAAAAVSASPSFTKIDGKWVASASRPAEDRRENPELLSKLASKPRNLFGEGACDWHDVMRLKRSDAGAAWFITTGTGTVVCKSITCQFTGHLWLAAREMHAGDRSGRTRRDVGRMGAALKSGCLQLVESRAATEGTKMVLPPNSPDVSFEVF